MALRCKGNRYFAQRHTLIAQLFRQRDDFRPGLGVGLAATAFTRGRLLAIARSLELSDQRSLLELGDRHDFLKSLGISLIPATAPDFFTEDTPTAVLVRQVLGAYQTDLMADLVLVAGPVVLANVHPKIVQERLGHANIATTMDLYAHVMPGMQDEAASRVDAALRAAISKRTRS